MPRSVHLKGLKNPHGLDVPDGKKVAPSSSLHCFKRAFKRIRQVLKRGWKLDFKRAKRTADTGPDLFSWWEQKQERGRRNPQPNPSRRLEPPSEPRVAMPAPKTLSLEPVSDAVLEKTAQRMLVGIRCYELARLIHVRWNRRLKTTAGLANYALWSVAINPRIAAFGMEEVDRTLRHELAHLVARHRAGRRRIQPHGEEWRQACRDLGLEEEKRCHELPLPRRRLPRKIVYRCRHCQAEVRRVKPFQRAVACLKCCRAFNRGHYDERYRFVLVA